MAQRVLPISVTSSGAKGYSPEGCPSPYPEMPSGSSRMRLEGPARIGCPWLRGEGFPPLHRNPGGALQIGSKSFDHRLTQGKL